MASQQKKRRKKATPGERLTELVRSMNRGEFVNPSKLTLVEHLRDWIKKAAPALRPSTQRVYKYVIEQGVAKATLGAMPLQRVRASDLEAYYAALKLKATSVTLHHAVLRRALRQAVRDRQIIANPAAEVEHRPRVRKADRTEAARKSGRRARPERFSRLPTMRARRCPRSCTWHSTRAPARASWSV